MVNIDKLRIIASEWHSGQWSPLYAFSSTGTITAGIIEEIQNCINDCVKQNNKKEMNKLNKLLQYVKSNIDITDN